MVSSEFTAEDMSEKADVGREAWYDDGKVGRGGVAAGPDIAQGGMSGMNCAFVGDCFVVSGAPKATTCGDLLM